MRGSFSSPLAVSLILLGSYPLQADFFVKGVLHAQGGYRYGHNVPDNVRF